MLAQNMMIAALLQAKASYFFTHLRLGCGTLDQAPNVSDKAIIVLALPQVVAKQVPIGR